MLSRVATSVGSLVMIIQTVRTRGVTCFLFSVNSVQQKWTDVVLPSVKKWCVYRERSEQNCGRGSIGVR